MTKYRLRRPDGRLLGPFDERQLLDLKRLGHILGDEEAQVYPTGNWIEIDKAPFYQELIKEDHTSILPQENQSKDGTFVFDLTKIKNQKKEKEIESYQNEQIPSKEQLSETIILTSTNNLKVSAKGDGSQTNKIIEQIKDELDPEFNSHEKTIINPEAQKEIEKIRRAQAEEAAKRFAEEKEIKRQEEEAKLFELALADHTSTDLTNETTQVINLREPQILEMAISGESEIEEEMRGIQEKNLEIEEDKDQSLEQQEEELKKNKKKRTIISVAAIIVICAILFPEKKEKKKTFKHLEPKIIFPIPFDVSDYEKAQAEFNRGISAFNSGTYQGLIKAGLAFKASYENNHESNYENLDKIKDEKEKSELAVRYSKSLDALGFMFRSYGEQLKNSRTKMSDIQTLFQIIQSKRPYLLKDPNGVIGLNLFYDAIQKPDTSIDVIDKYLKLNSKNVTQDLFAFYVLSLLKQGRVDLAKQFYQALLKAGIKNAYAYSAILEYQELNQETEKFKQYLEEALKKFPRKTSFILMKAEDLVEENKFKEAATYLKKAEDLGLDNSNFNRGKYYELYGLIMAARNKTKEATDLLSKSLELKNSYALRMKLASLTDGKNTDTSALINKSKAVKFLLDGQNFLNEKKYNLALSYAAKATEAFPEYVPAEVFLSKVQLRLGLAQEGIKTLEKIAEKNSRSKFVNLALVDAYIDTYKFNDAKKRIQTIASLKLQDTWEYASANARLFYKMGDLLQAMSWLKTSISLNPINDTDIFLMAQILLKKANFDKARIYLNKCMEIDPMNADYRIAYSKLLYETEDDRAAIGYLLSLKDVFGASPKILSEIAIFYYRSGKVKDFIDIKKQLEKEFSTDKNFYEFLIKSAQIDDRQNEVPSLVEKLLEIEPGELEYMMIAGRSLFESGKLVDAAKWFKRIRDKLPTYPKVLFYMAKIDHLSGDSDSALKKIQENIKANGETDDDLVFMAEIHLEKNNDNESEIFFKKAQKINPRSYEAIIGLADLSIKKSNIDFALDLYKSAIKLRQDEPAVHKKIGDAYRQLGQGALAIEAYKLYLDMEPNSIHKNNIESYINMMK